MWDGGIVGHSTIVELRSTPAQRLRDKTIRVFSGESDNEDEEDQASLVVDKAAAMQGGLGLLPRFVVDFMIAALITRRKIKNPTKRINVDAIREQIKKGTVDASRKKTFIADLMDNGLAQMIGNVSIDPRPEKDTFIVRIAQLGGDTKSSSISTTPPPGDKGQVPSPWAQPRQRVA